MPRPARPGAGGLPASAHPRLSPRGEPAAARRRGVRGEGGARPADPAHESQRACGLGPRTVDGAPPLDLDAFGARTCKDARATTPSGSPLDCRGYRLPTEAEWLLAATAGSGSFGLPRLPAPRGDGGECPPLPGLERTAWYCHTAGETPHPVGSLEANAWGFHDLFGNVAEWTWDRHQERPPLAAATDPLGAPAGKHRVVRGGSVYLDAARLGRRGDRERRSSTSASHLIGFRVARTLHGAEPAPPGTREALTLRAVAPAPVDTTACAELRACCDAIPKKAAELRKACADLADAGERLGDAGVCRSSLDSYRSACPGAARRAR